ncbi:hypothetical protein [Escherichia coli]|uniref:hypothetical protein n=1 Tax=Escherichia coli TaxID=562 RepID=UPI000CFC60AE|nr:hypothetical protein [Escherichia coli]
MATKLVFTSKVKNEKRVDHFSQGTVVSCKGDGKESVILIIKTGNQCVWGFDLESNEICDLPPNMKVTELDVKISILGPVLNGDNQ